MYYFQAQVSPVDTQSKNPLLIQLSPSPAKCSSRHFDFCWQ